jgi:hypothetical protein
MAKNAVRTDRISMPAIVLDTLLLATCFDRLTAITLL